MKFETKKCWLFKKVCNIYNDKNNNNNKEKEERKIAFYNEKAIIQKKNIKKTLKIWKTADIISIFQMPFKHKCHRTPHRLWTLKQNEQLNILKEN